MDASLAKEMFSENRFKAKQIPSIAEKSKSGKETELTSEYTQCMKSLCDLEAFTNAK